MQPLDYRKRDRPSDSRPFLTHLVPTVAFAMLAGAAVAHGQQVPRVRTPDERFANLKGYPFAPHYAEINGLRMHYVDEGQATRGTFPCCTANLAGATCIGT